MLEKKYPVIECDLTKARHNMDEVISRCTAAGIRVTGVIKGFNGQIDISREYRKAATYGLATSRLEHIEECREAGIEGPYMAIRVPMKSEVCDLVRLADSCLISELETILEIDRECARQDKRMGVVIMADLGDLREGFWDKEALIKTACETEKLEHVELLGVGTNLGCYGAIVPTVENMNELISIAERIEERIGRKLEIISGGATTSLPLVLNGTMPKRINHLRLGEGILQAKDLQDLFMIDMSYLYTDCFTVYAEVVEVKVKPSHPVGKIFVDAYGFTPEYPNRGMRKRALCALGKLDFVYTDMLIPKEKGIEVLGGSSDHLILDVEEYEKDLAVGDVLAFDVRYATMMYTTASRYMRYSVKR